MATKKTSTDKTPIEKAIDAAVAPVEEKKAPAKKEAAPKKETKAVAEKKEVKTEIAVQFAGKSYTQDDLVKIAKDVWKFDLKQKAADLVSVELYVKPEESMVYYVFNGTECGSFAI